MEYNLQNLVYVVPLYIKYNIMSVSITLLTKPI